MNVIVEKFKNPIVTGIVGFVIGVAIGLFALGWGLWPVKWTNATPEYLSPEWQEEYTRMAIEAFGQNSDVQKAQDRFTALGDNGETVLTAVVENPESMSTVFIDAFSSAVSVIPETSPTEAVETVEPEEGATSTKPPLNKVLTILIPILCVLSLVLVAVVLYLFVFRGRVARTGETTPAMEAAEAKKQADYTDYVATGAEPPLAQFMASYKYGDDLFDDSFSIDSASGEFLGECGVGISEMIGVGDPKKVTAFEVWLFDKNDIQTITKVIMSSHAFYDNNIRQRLEAKGEPVLAEPSTETVLETQTLQLVAKVVDMSYGEGAMPEQSYFDHLLLELAIWPK
jgi:hypothetical protein